MAASVTFNVLAENTSDINSIVCRLAADYYRQQQRVFIYAQDQSSAEQIDELLWQFEDDSFVPHNLAGEGPQYGAPVEISWLAPTNRRHVLINVSNIQPEFIQQFSKIIDFVPTDEAQKQLARQRYRQYQQLGYAIETTKLD